MAQDFLQSFSYEHAIASFLVAYVAVSALGFVVYLLICKRMGTSPWDQVEIRDNKAYGLTQKFLPFINLVVWTLCAWIYFSGNAADYTNALALGVFWLILAALIDYVGFVLIKHPLSVDAKGFYIHQFPWLYMTYLAVFAAPFCYVAFIA